MRLASSGDSANKADGSRSRRRQESGLTGSPKTAAAIMNNFPGGAAAVAGWWGPPGMDVPLGTQLIVAGDDVAASVLRNGEPVRTDRFEGPAGSVAACFRQLGVRSGVGPPITLQGRWWGVARPRRARLAS
jgi:hypothetical protein